MKNFISYFIQLLLLVIFVYLIISYDQKIEFFWNGIIFTSKISLILFIIGFLILLSLLFQRLYLYIRNSPKRLKSNLQISKYQKGIKSIVLAIAAMSNNDTKQLIVQSKKIDNYLKDNPISIILRAEAARKEKKFNLAENQYNKMLLNPDIKILGLRGLLEQNLKNEDYHHALIYAEQIYQINYKLEWIYETIIKIISKTKDWQKLIDINNDAQNKKIISKKQQLKLNAIALYEIALIKESFSLRDSLVLLNEANNSRPYFPPIVKKLISSLIDDNQISKARKILFRSWSFEPHQIYFEELIKIVKKEDTNLISIINKITNSNNNHYESIIAKVKANIIETKWEEAKNIIKPILSNRPTKTICELMSKIELGISGNVQKANSWISRSQLGDREKTWICKYTGIEQDQWSSINHNGFIDSLEWTWPKASLNNQTKQIDYIVPNIIGPV